MIKIELASGRKVSIERIDIENIYSGVLEGTPEMVAKFLRRRLRERIQQRFWETEALLIIDNQEPTLPPYRCIGHFRSAPVQPDHFYSSLLVCWFAQDVDVNLPVMVKQMLDTIDWEVHAVDTHVDDL